MLKSRRGKVVGRVIGALAIALAVSAGPIAGPASAAGLGQFAGTGTGYALRVTLDVRPLIAAVPALQGVFDTVWGALGNTGAFPGQIDQFLIKTTSDADASNTKARTSLAEGLINLDSLEATAVGQNLSKVVQTLQIPSADLPLITGDVGSLAAKVLAGPDVGSAGGLESLSVGLPLDGLPTDLLDDLLGQLTGLVDGLVGDLTDVLNGLLGSAGGAGLGGDLVGQLSGTIGGLTGSLGLGDLNNLTSGLGLGSTTDLGNATAVAGGLDDLLNVDALIAQITSLLNTNLLDGALAELNGLLNLTTAGKVGDGSKAIADSVASLQGLSVLGGLVDVDLLNIKSHSEASGVAGSAKNTHDCSIADVNIGGGALGLSLDGSSISINGTEVPVVGELVGQVKGLVDQILNVLGIDVGLCETADVQVAADGRSASQSVSALRVEVAPLGLFRLVIDPTVQTAVAAQAADVPSTASTTTDPTLPQTGAGAIATLFGGGAIAAGAVFIRRRLAA